LGGQNNTASGSDSIAGGAGSSASQLASIALGNNAQATASQAFATGFNTIASGQSSVVSGENNSASGSWSQASGSRANAQLQGERALANGRFANTGDAQYSDLVVRAATLGGGPFELFLDGAGQRIVLNDNTSYSFVIAVIARDNQTNTNHYILEGTLKRNAGAGTTVLVGAVTKRIIVEEVAAWDANLIADNINGAAVIQVTGAAAANIRWVAYCSITRVNY
jgi:hypothetical protein